MKVKMEGDTITFKVSPLQYIDHIMTGIGVIVGMYRENMPMVLVIIGYLGCKGLFQWMKEANEAERENEKLRVQAIYKIK